MRRGDSRGGVEEIEGVGDRDHDVGEVRRIQELKDRHVRVEGTKTMGVREGGGVEEEKKDARRLMVAVGENGENRDWLSSGGKNQ
ncbi:uncharacterized protein A4U43_C08F21540 [Asparagus officinalis]|nr:uncharacterized protein A4U43_C08F21540 [Asparagus officinalis]